MNRLAILTESAATLPDELVKQYGIHVLPLKINMGQTSLRDGIDITPEAFYQGLESMDELPTTSTITPAEVLEVLTAEAGQSEGAVGVFISGELSASVSVGQMVKDMGAPIPLVVVDSRTAGMAEGFVVLEAARAAAEGLGLSEVVARAEAMTSRVHLVVALETLEYLRRGGRIGAATNFLGTALQMKPIVGIRPRGGEVVGIARPRTWPKALKTLLDLMADEVGERPVHVAVSHGNRPEEAAKLAERIRQRFEVRELYTTFFTAVMGAHAGPVVALSFYAD